MDERWKSPEIRAAEAELGAAIESADKIIAEAVRATGATGPAEPDQAPGRDERDDGEDTFLRDAW